MKHLPVATILLAATLPSTADYILDVDLGVLPLGSTQLQGTTAASIDPGPPARIIGGHDEALYLRGVDLNPAANWGNEIVYQFELEQPSILSITSNAIEGDPDFFVMDGLAVSIDPLSGKPAGEDGLGAAYLDFAPPETEQFRPLLPGIYYLMAEHFDGFDGGVLPGDGVFDVTLTVELATDALDFLIDLGPIVRTDTPFTLDTFGSSYDTELALFDMFGGLLAENDDAGGGQQSELDLPVGLLAGTYYVVVAGNDTTFGDPFMLSTGGATGDWSFNFPFGPILGRQQEIGTTDSGFAATEAQFFFFTVSDPPASFIDLGALAEANVAFSINTVGSDFDTQIALYDGEGFVHDFNDDIAFFGNGDPNNILQSELEFLDGLAEGEYFVALSGYPNLFFDGFQAFVDPLAGGSEGGQFLLNHPLGTADGVLSQSMQQWFRFTIDPGSPAGEAIRITDIDFNRAANQFTVTWESSRPGPFDIWVGTAGDLAALSAPPDNILPTAAAIGVNSPFTFTVPGVLQGEDALFLQVTD